MEMGMPWRMEMSIRWKWDEFTGIEGTAENLLKVLDELPQVTAKGKIQYLIAGGWGIELLTGLPREHHDIDALILDERTPSHFGTDTRKPDDYFTVISTTSKDVRESHTTSRYWDYCKREVHIPRAEFLLVSKIYGGFGKEPRDKDYEDAARIVRTQDLDTDNLRHVFTKTRADNIEECVDRLIEINARYRGKERMDTKELVSIYKSIVKR